MAGRDYLAKSIQLPKRGSCCLVFFQDYLEDNDEMLARDAYDEFAKTPYSGLKEIKDRMHHDKILEWVAGSVKIEPSCKQFVLDDAGHLRPATGHRTV